MKKLILSVALLAGITFIACSEEDNVIPTVAYSGCQTCEIAADTLSNRANENYDICVGAADTIVYVNGAYTGIRPARYFELFCDNAYGEVTPPGTDPDVNCVTCAAYTAEGGTEVPQQEICKSPDGKAIVQGTLTTIDYEAYLAAQREANRTCQ